MEEKLSLKQALIMTRNTLAELNVPVAMVEQIGLPVSRAVANLNACIEAIVRQEEQEFDIEVPEEKEADLEDA